MITFLALSWKYISQTLEHSLLRYKSFVDEQTHKNNFDSLRSVQKLKGKRLSTLHNSWHSLVVVRNNLKAFNLMLFIYTYTFT